MTDTPTSESDSAAETAEPRRSEFESLDDERPLSLVGEFWLFLREEQKWWLAPIIAVLLLVGAAIALHATGAAPFIYALF